MSFNLYNTIYVINISSISEQSNQLCYHSTLIIKGKNSTTYIVPDEREYGI